MGSLDRIKWGEDKIVGLVKTRLSCLGLGQVSFLNKGLWIWGMKILGRC